MAFLDTKRDRAAFLIFMLGLGLAYALWPFSTGLIGAPVLYIMFVPIYRGLVGRGLKPGLAAGLVVLLGILLILGPGLSFLGVVANEAQQMAGGVIRSPLLTRLRELRIGPYDVGAQIEALGSSLVNWIGTSAVGLIGTATRLGIQLTIAFFGLYYLLQSPDTAWRQVRPFIPFSVRNAEILRERFRDVTISTLIGTGLTASIQGLLVGVAFWITGIPTHCSGASSRLSSQFCRWLEARSSGDPGSCISGWKAATAGPSRWRSGGSWWSETSITSSGPWYSGAGPRSTLSSPSSGPSPASSTSVCWDC